MHARLYLKGLCFSLEGTDSDGEIAPSRWHHVSLLSHQAQQQVVSVLGPAVDPGAAEPVRDVFLEHRHRYIYIYCMYLTCWSLVCVRVQLNNCAAVVWTINARFQSNGWLTEYIFSTIYLMVRVCRTPNKIQIHLVGHIIRNFQLVWLTLYLKNQKISHYFEELYVWK